MPLLTNVTFCAPGFSAAPERSHLYLSLPTSLAVTVEGVLGSEPEEPAVTVNFKYPGGPLPLPGPDGGSKTM